MTKTVEIKQAAVLVKNHTKALHDTLGIDADTVDGLHASELILSKEVHITLIALADEKTF